ncbi:hypothetical protein B0H11DRAFT_1677904, partial [Mycena galericulata]
SNDFLQVGYRGRITAGKESALQEGFDTGFASADAPLGREIGPLRGMASALVALHVDKDAMLAKARAIALDLAAVHFTEVVLRYLEAEEHVRQHLANEDDDLRLDEKEELSEKRKMEVL